MTFDAARKLFTGLLVTLSPGLDPNTVEIIFPVALTAAVRERVGYRAQQWREGSWRMVDWSDKR